jgi:hypothetical protein
MQLYHPRHKTAHRALQWLFLRFAPFYRRKYQTDTSGYNTTCGALAHTRARTPCTDTRYHRHAGRCTAQRSRPIIIRYIRVQQIANNASPAGVSVSTCAGSARRLAIWHRSPVSLAPSTRCGSPAAGARRAARNHWRLPPHLFSGFRPIANRGQQ